MFLGSFFVTGLVLFGLSFIPFILLVISFLPDSLFRKENGTIADVKEDIADSGISTEPMITSTVLSTGSYAVSTTVAPSTQPEAESDALVTTDAEQFNMSKAENNAPVTIDADNLTLPETESEASVTVGATTEAESEAPTTEDTTAEIEAIERKKGAINNLFDRAEGLDDIPL